MANETLTKFLALCAEDETLKNFAKHQKTTVVFQVSDTGEDFFFKFEAGVVTAGTGKPEGTVDLMLRMNSKTMENLLSGKLDGESAVMSGALYVSNEWKAMEIQGIQYALTRCYKQALG